MSVSDFPLGSSGGLVICLLSWVRRRFCQKKSVRGKKWLDMFSQAKRTESENVFFFFFLRLIQ